jgi:hypothetical protein
MSSSTDPNQDAANAVVEAKYAFDRAVDAGDTAAQAGKLLAKVSTLIGRMPHGFTETKKLQDTLVAAQTALTAVQGDVHEKRANSSAEWLHAIAKAKELAKA